MPRLSLPRLLVSMATIGASAAGCAGGGEGDAPVVAAPPGTTPQGCSVEHLSPPQLRLLTRREYNQTVRDWLGGPLGMGDSGPTCSEDADCVIQTESCVASACQADPCALHTFIFPANGQSYSSVHVAGSFNGWPGTAGEGGWAMTYVAAIDSWVAKQTVPDGDHLYKFVVDESTWVADPTNPNGEPDGFGGQNSRLSQQCAGSTPPPEPPPEGLPEDLAEGFPVESRPEHYPFDNAASNLVTSVHVEQYMRAGARIAAAVTQKLDWLPCSGTDEACARTIAATLGAKAFRRPLAAEEVAKYAALITDQPQWSDGVRVALRVMLSSPLFLYRAEIGEPQADGTTRLDAYEVASLLSYTFWGTMPDDALMAAAAEGTLDTPEGVAAEARRLLDDPRAEAVLGRFAQQWLGVERVLTANKNPSRYPDFDAAMAQAMLEETARFFTDAVYEGDGRFDQLLLRDPTGEGRGGVLGLPAVLASYALPDQTSPILRGLFVRERLLCQTLPEPPAQIPQLPEISEDATTRERFAQHSADPVCNSCHQYIDGLGFGFEGFDAIGARRTEENGQPIDERGHTIDLELDGSKDEITFDGLPALASRLVESPAAQACFAKQTYRYAFGQLEDEADACELSRLNEAFAAGDRDLRGLLVALTTLDRFTLRRPRPEEE